METNSTLFYLLFLTYKTRKSWVQERILLVNLDGDDSSGKPHPFMNKQCQNIQWTSMLNNEPVL